MDEREKVGSGFGTVTLSFRREHRAYRPVNPSHTVRPLNHTGKIEHKYDLVFGKSKRRKQNETLRGLIE
jgi:hypothetical protein